MTINVDIANAHSWESLINVSPETLAQIISRDNADLINHRDLYSSQTCNKVVYSDASCTGYGGYEVNTMGGVSNGMCFSVIYLA